MSAEGEDGYDSKCIFCRISNDQENDAELLHSDEELACFKDIRPGAPYHYLVVPKKHIGNCKTLTSDHAQLVQNMVAVGKNVLQKNNVTDVEDIRRTAKYPWGHMYLGLGTVALEEKGFTIIGYSLLLEQRDNGTPFDIVMDDSQEGPGCLS